MKKLTYICTFYFFISSLSQASVEALFHPYDPTLEKISSYIEQAQQQIDIAMYNIDVVDESAVIQTLSNTVIQTKIKTGQLHIRMIFEGYDTLDGNLARMKNLEALGIDVRYLNSTKKVHHKFAVIDSNTDSSKLISGSANWSMGSRRNYNENILFIENEKSITAKFQNEFNLLWENAEEYGAAGPELHIVALDAIFTPHLQVFFNSQNFEFEKGNIKNGPIDKGYFLTKRIVEGINRAQRNIKIATTRFKLAPVYDAVTKALSRGVKVQIVLSMEEYVPFYIRKKTQFKECQDLYTPKCSSGTNYSVFLSPEFNQDPNLELRIKYFSLNPEDYLIKQMHNKYVIVDDQEILTGSFNWSNSSEWDNIENIIYLNYISAPEAIHQYENDFAKLWNMNRNLFQDYKNKIQDAAKGNGRINCLIQPMVLTEPEIDQLMFPVGTTKRAENICTK